MRVVATGFEEINKTFHGLSGAARAGLKKGINRGGTVLVRGIRSQIPVRLKSAKRAIGWRFAKAKGGAEKGNLVAKVGAGVGKQVPPSARQGKPGVGLGKFNIHWAIMGTAQRRHRSGHPTGAMPPILAGIVQTGFKQATPQALQVIHDTTLQHLRKAAGK